MTDRGVVATAVLVVIAALLARPVPLPLAAAVLLVAVALRRTPLLALALALLVTGRADQQLAALAEPLPPVVQGLAELVDDPEPQPFGVRLVVRIEDRRLLAQVPRDLAGAVRGASTGDRFVVRGTTSRLRGVPAGWIRARHLAGRLTVTRLERGPPPAPWFAATAAVQRAYRAGSASFDPELVPLYLGMVIGDDRGLSEVRQHRFRSAGLSHLTAVSGQNVAFLLAVCRPLLSRMGRRWRLVATLMLLCAMVAVTGADPSVLRAATMAALGVAAAAHGRLAPAVRLLGVAIVALVVVDPMLVHSLGFRLSVAATAGLVVLTRPIEARLPGPSWLRLPLAVTLAAQLATAPLLVGLGGVSPVAVVANLVAVPAAGAVMMLGVVVGAVAGLVVEPLAAVLQLPARLLVGWVDLVARLASGVRVAPLGPMRLLALGLVLAVVLSGRGTPGPARGVQWHRRAVDAAASMAVLAICWPVSAPAGPSRLADGVTMVVGRCGGVAVSLEDGAGPAAALEAIGRVAPPRLDVLVVGESRGAREAAAAVTEQWSVRRRVELSGDAPSGWRVGGVEVVARSGDLQIELSEAACRLTP